MAACAHGEKPSIGNIMSIIDNSRVRTRGFHLDVVVATAVLVVDSNVRNDDDDDDDVEDDELHHFLNRIRLERYGAICCCCWKDRFDVLPWVMDVDDDGVVGGFRVVMWCHQVDRIRNDISGGRLTNGSVVSMGDCNNAMKNRGDGVVSLTRIICCCGCCIHLNDSDGEECRRCCGCWNTGAYAVMTIDVDMILINIIIMNIMMVVFIF